jgi:hypothetical protein
MGDWMRALDTLPGGGDWMRALEVIGVDRAAEPVIEPCDVDRAEGPGVVGPSAAGAVLPASMVVGPFGGVDV